MRKHGPRRPLEERFWEKVNKNGPIPKHCPELGPCWVWTGCLNSDGYGNIKVRGLADGAHVVGFVLQGGERQPGMSVRHRCDNRACVRDAHLVSGTHTDNMKDMMLRGRAASGARNGRHTHPESTRRGTRVPTAILTERDVMYIRTLYKCGVSQSALAREFGVKFMTVHAIVCGVNWKHLPL